MAEMDERSQAAAKAAAEKVAAGMPQVNPETGALSDMFTGKFGIFEVLLFHPIYGAELREIKRALEAKNEALANTLWNRSKWGKLDTDAQQRILMEAENLDLYKERLNKFTVGLRRLLAPYGIKIDDEKIKDYYDRGIDTDVILDEMITGISGKTAGGTAADALGALRATARANGFDLDKDFGNQIDGWLQRVSRGEDLDDFKRIIRQQAKLGLPDKVGTLLDEGLDLSNIYAPYRNRMANLLELNPDAISLDDPLLRSAYGQDKEMSIYDFQRAVRQDPRWQYTDNAREQVSSVALKVLRDFGFQG